MNLKLSLCNEVLQPLALEQQCVLAASQGYTGLELAPFTLADDPTTLDEAAALKNSVIAEELALPPVKIHCSILAEDAIKAAVNDYKVKHGAAAASNA